MGITATTEGVTMTETATEGVRTFTDPEGNVLEPIQDR